MMMRKLTGKTVLLTFLSSFMIGQAIAETSQIKAGDALPNFTSLTDQQDKAVSIASDTQTLFFSADKSAADLLSNYLDAQTPTWLSDHHAVYLADIHKMPKFVASMFALPSLREKKYSIILGREEADMAMLPSQKGCVTVIPVIESKLGDSEFVCSSEALAAKLK